MTGAVPQHVFRSAAQSDEGECPTGSLADEQPAGLGKPSERFAVTSGVTAVWKADAAIGTKRKRVLALWSLLGGPESFTLSVFVFATGKPEKRSP